jgi:hypothetical protein
MGNRTNSRCSEPSLYGIGFSPGDGDNCGERTDWSADGKKKSVAADRREASDW